MTTRAPPAFSSHKLISWACLLQIAFALPPSAFSIPRRSCGTSSTRLASAALAERYSIHSTQPSQCAEDLLAGRADLGLIPIASLTPDLAIVPGCTIASLDRVRSIQLIVKLDRDQAGSKTSAASGQHYRRRAVRR